MNKFGLYVSLIKFCTPIEYIYIYIYIYKLADHGRGRVEGSFFPQLLHWGVGEGATPYLDCFTYPWSMPYSAEC